jgi:hypothetical protein
MITIEHFNTEKTAFVNENSPLLRSSPKSHFLWKLNNEANIACSNNRLSHIQNKAARLISTIFASAAFPSILYSYRPTSWPIQACAVDVRHVQYKEAASYFIVTSVRYFTFQNYQV